MKTLTATLSLVAILFMSCTKKSSNEASSKTAESIGDVLPPNLTKNEQALLNDVRQMFDSNDVSIMMKRVHNDGPVDKFRNDHDIEYLQSVLEGGLGRIELTRVDPPRYEDTLFDETTVEWSLPLKWELIVHHPVDESGNNISHVIPLSNHEGRIVSIRQNPKK